MRLGEFIRNYREKNELSLRAFSIKTGLSHSYIDKLEKNESTVPTLVVLKQIATAINISLNELIDILDADGQVTIPEVKLAPNKIPVLGRIPAGIPIEAIEDILDYEEISEKMVNSKNEYFGLRVDGHSMEPKYINGDTLIIKKTNQCENGQDAIVMVNGNDATFKKFFVNDNGVTLQAINPEYQSYFYSSAEVMELPVRVIGVPVEIRRSV